MIEPEDIHEAPKTNYTPVIIMSITAALLLIVGFISYRDYINAKADERVKASDDRLRKLEEKLDRLNERNQSAPQQVAQSPVPQRDPEIEALRKQLDAMKQQTAAIKKQSDENSMTMQKVLDSGPAPSVDSIPGMASFPPTAVRDDMTLPDFVRDSVAAPPGGYRSPRAQAELTEAQKRIKNAAAIGKIIAYNEDWNLVTINAGKSQGVEVGQRWTIRRGAENLGVVKVFEAFPSEANANLVTGNREIESALKPKVGDEIISSDPF